MAMQQDKAIIAYERLHIARMPHRCAHYRLANYSMSKEYEKPIIYFQSFLDFNSKRRKCKDAFQKLRSKLMMAVL
jgi:hypothetical protein